ncbi:Arginyl-tRNA--protein transferase [Trichinella pseudospiralis]
MSSNRLCSYDSSLSNFEDDESIMRDLNDKDKQANSTQKRQKDERKCRDDYGSREKPKQGTPPSEKKGSRSAPGCYRNSSQSRICNLARHRILNVMMFLLATDIALLHVIISIRSRSECSTDALIRQSISEKLMKKVNERKLLWKGNNSTAKKHWEEALSTCEDKKSMEKFRKLIGMKDGNGKEKEPGTSSTEDTTSGRKQENFLIT